MPMDSPISFSVKCSYSQNMRVVRFSGICLLGIYVLLHLLYPTVWSELFAYNLVPIAAIVGISCAPRINDAIAKPSIAIALTLWVIGSVVTSIDNYFSWSAVSNRISSVLYLLFYPLAIIGLPRLLAANRKLAVIELVDASIFGLGLSTLGSALFAQKVLPHFGGNMADTFFAITYPVADLILICVVIVTVSMQGYSKRGVVLSFGVMIFALTDFLFLWQNINGNYFMGSTLDVGWVLGLILIAESFWQSGIDSKAREGINPILISISVSLSATLLALIAIRPSYFPRFILIPAIATLALAFARMALALTQARNIGQERLLARTDELTGLPNRRRLVSEIDAFVQKEGALLLLDLDGFKPINDVHGHETGDKILQQVALRFERALPHGALLARLGGDEFGVLLEGANESTIEVALALRATLSYPFHINNQEIKLGVSIGVAKNTGENDLLLRADNAMYTAKREGLGVYRL
jgi:diguanylate cyclase (GGDEF)-like protein